MPPKVVLPVLFNVDGRFGTVGDSVADVIADEVSAPVATDDTAADVPLLTSQGFGGDGMCLVSVKEETPQNISAA